MTAQEGRELVMTANHKERLDPALVRPGRADVHTELGLVGAATARRLFERFFPGEGDLAEAFEQRLGEQKTQPCSNTGLAFDR